MTSRIVSRNIVKFQGSDREEIEVCVREIANSPGASWEVFVDGGFLADGSACAYFSEPGPAFRLAAEEALTAYQAS